MTPKFQNRLVGAIVLVSLGVIILPDVFDGEKLHYQEDIQTIPLQTDIDEATIKSPIQAPVAVDDVVLPKVVVSDIKTDDPIEIAKKEMDTPIENDTASDQSTFQEAAWIIRLGTFRNHKNANALVQRLQTQGYAAQVKPNDLKEGDLARVEVGPELSAKKIASMRAELEKLTGLKGQVIKFNPVTL